MLEFDINPELEVQPDMKGKDSKQELLSFEEIQRLQTVSLVLGRSRPTKQLMERFPSGYQTGEKLP